MKQLGQEYANLEQRRQYLEDNCDAIETIGYMKRFSADQITAMKSDLSDVAIEISDIEEAKKEVLQDYKMQLDPLKETQKELLTHIKQKSEYISEKCYKFIDYETKTVEFYTAEGEMVSSRPIQPQEMQKTVFHLSNTGTDNN